MTTPTDPSYASQTFLTVIGDIETIWSEFNGNGIQVGVYDDGVEYSHEDLATNYDSSLHFVHNGITYDPFPLVGADAHGTACAGIIGAVGQNGTGGVGVAWGVTLTGVNFLEGLPNLAAEVASLAWGQHFDLISNSWGRTPSFGSYQNLANVNSDVYDEVYNGMEVAIENGRAGLGTVIMQAAGNETSDANADGINAVRYTTTVAATELDGFVADYSNYGVSILVSAPASNYTTDRTDSDGYTNDNYISDFDGTSAATPVVSGVVALMLEANEDLGWRNVQDILAISAAHTGSAYGSPASGFEQSAWVENSATNWNGGGMSFSLSYGFGMVDAFSAVRMAEAWLVMHDEAQDSSNEVSQSFAILDSQLISDNATITSTMTVVSGGMYVEDLMVTIDLTHTFTSDLVILLYAPDGSAIPLSVFQGGGSEFTGSWSFGVTALLGAEVISGDWTLSIEDTESGDTGLLSGWSMDFYGQALDTNTTHHITDDFQMYAAVDVDRMTISDSNGGSDDWLNMAAIAAKIILDLDSAGSNDIRVGGVTWADIEAGTNIENAYLGDGDDKAFGNSSANEIHGARGNDTLNGYGNDDVLLGGAGNDTLKGQKGADTLEGNEGTDRLEGGKGKDELRGHEGADSVFGEGGDDKIFGGDNSDLLKGGSGGDIVEGGKGDDTIEGGDGKDLLEGGKGSDTIEGNVGDDMLLGNDGDDRLEGHKGDDTLYGGNGSDTLQGGNGSDILAGGSGDDTLNGGAQADRFVFNNNDDEDTVVDFNNNTDTIELNDNLWSGVRNASQVLTDFGVIIAGDAVLDFGGGDVLVIENIGSLGLLTNDIDIV
ncbi:S8 family serine peptidase [Planktotalea sp.]|uniref:S8 family serine peptidase n=1 Tax=Planktotalea sp. TaxID=2029877 RepID=UPI003D6B3901